MKGYYLKKVIAHMGDELKIVYSESMSPNRLLTNNSKLIELVTLLHAYGRMGNIEYGTTYYLKHYLDTTAPQRSYKNAALVELVDEHTTIILDLINFNVHKYDGPVRVNTVTLEEDFADIFLALLNGRTLKDICGM